MNVKCVLFSIALLSTCIAQSAIAEPLDENAFLLDLELRDVAARDVAWSLASVLGAKLAFDPLLDHDITIELHQVRLLEALDRLCQSIHLADPESHSCEWRIRAGEPPVLSVGFKALSLDATRANLDSLLYLFGRLSDASAVEIDPGLRAQVDLHLDDVFWFEALDAVCEQAGCTWTLERSPGSAPKLVVRSSGDSATDTVSVRLRGGPPGTPDAMMTEVGFALRPMRGDGAISGAALFVGAERTFRISAGEGSPWEAVLARVSLGPDQTALVPFLVNCAQPPQVMALEPVSFPLERVWMSTAREARLELHPAATGPGTSLASPTPVSCVRWADVSIGVRLENLGETAGSSPGATVVLSADEPGRVLQLTMPSTAARPRTFADAAIVVLDQQTDGRVELGIVTAADGSPRMQRHVLSPHEVWSVSELLPYADYRVEVTLLPPGSKGWPH